VTEVIGFQFFHRTALQEGREFSCLSKIPIAPSTSAQVARKIKTRKNEMRQNFMRILGLLESEVVLDEVQSTGETVSAEHACNSSARATGSIQAQESGI
jgi:hypothetical protein